MEMNDLDKEAGEMLSDRAAQLVAAKNRLEELSNNLMSANAARMDENQEDYYILCGWMARMMVDRFLKRSKMMTKSSLSLKMTMMLTSVSLRPSLRIQSFSSLLKCSFRCMDFPPTMRWTRLYLSD